MRRRGSIRTPRPASPRYAARRTLIWDEFQPLLEDSESSKLPESTEMADAPDTVKCHCPKCGPGRKAYVRGEHCRTSSQQIDGGNFSVDFSETYRILECAGCETLFCQRTDYCSEWGDPWDEDSYFRTVTGRRRPNGNPQSGWEVGWMAIYTSSSSNYMLHLTTTCRSWRQSASERPLIAPQSYSA